MEEIHRPRYGEGAWSFHAVRSPPLSRHQHVFTSLDSLNSGLLGVLWRLCYLGLIDLIIGQ